MRSYRESTNPGRPSRSSSHSSLPTVHPHWAHPCCPPNPGTHFPVQHPPWHVKNSRARIRPRLRMTDSYIHKKGTATIPTLERQKQDKEVTIASATCRAMSQKAQRIKKSKTRACVAGWLRQTEEWIKFLLSEKNKQNPCKTQNVKWTTNIRGWNIWDEEEEEQCTWKIQKGSWKAMENLPETHHELYPALGY